MAKRDKRSVTVNSMSIVHYAIRNRNNPRQYYCNRSGGGWIDGIKNASTWGNLKGPTAVLLHIGEDNGELITLNCSMHGGKFSPAFMIRNKVTGEYALRVRSVNKKDDIKLWTPKIKDAAIWLYKGGPLRVINWMTTKGVKEIEDAEVVTMPIFLEG